MELVAVRSALKTSKERGIKDLLLPPEGKMLSALWNSKPPYQLWSQGIDKSPIAES
jgi:hypothetical protein